MFCQLESWKLAILLVLYIRRVVRRVDAESLTHLILQMDSEGHIECYCGGVVLAVTLPAKGEPPLPSIICSCRECTSTHGSPLMWASPMIDAKVRVVRGDLSEAPTIEANWKHWATSFGRFFCTNCGSHMFNQFQAIGAPGKMRGIFPGSLDDASRVAFPSLWYFARERVCQFDCPSVKRHPLSDESVGSKPPNAPLPTQELHGSCYCGGIEVTLSPATPVVSPVLCHCQSCRRACAGPFQYAAYFEGEKVQITKGQDLIRHHARKQDGVKRFFCSRCGSRIYNEWRSLKGVFPCLFESRNLPSSLHVDSHIYAAEAVWPLKSIQCGPMNVFLGDRTRGELGDCNSPDWQIAE
jgi:hypothetical protein